MLLARPGGAGKIETVNDKARMIANFWRAVTRAPEKVAKWCDWPVNEADMHARHKWLVSQLVPGTEFFERMHSDPAYCDVKIAGWWVWGICMWIGGGWCVEPNNHKHPKLDGIGKGVHAEAPHRRGRDRVNEANRPDLAVAHGVHADEWNARPHLGADLGVNAYSPGRRPAMKDAGHGVHLPALGNDRGLNGVSAAPCLEWFKSLQERLRRVRVACGDWERVLGDSVLGKGKNVGGRRPCAVLLDPPYPHDQRDPYLYSEDDASTWEAARQWAIEHGDDPELRIALCGYAGAEMPAGWTEHAWKAARGYAAEDNENRKRERIWFSPHCLPVEPAQRSLFAEVGS